MPPRRRKTAVAAQWQRKTTPRSKKGAPPIPLQESNQAEDPQDAVSEEAVIADKYTLQEEASVACGKEEDKFTDESVIEAAALPSKDVVLELSSKIEVAKEEWTALEESVKVDEPVPVARSAILGSCQEEEVKTEVDEWKVEEAEEDFDDFCVSEEHEDEDEGSEKEMIEEENALLDNEPAEEDDDEYTMADEVDYDSEPGDQEADEVMGEEEEDTVVGEIENSVRGEDDNDVDEGDDGGSNNEDDGGTEEEDNDRTEEEDNDGTEEEDDEETEEEDDKGGSTEEDDEGTEEEDTEGGNNEEDDEVSEEEGDTSEYTHAPLMDRKKREFEIFVTRLDKKTIEDDLRETFAPFGEIQSVRIVRHPTTQKSRGFAFIRYATAEQTKKALSELKHGAKVKGKLVRVLASQDNDTLYMGNICKTWTKDHVLATLKGYGVEQIEEMVLPDNPKTEGSSKGFAYLEFATHSDAMAAFRRLKKPDAVFGCHRSAKVAFAQPLHPNEEALLQVKTLFVEGLPASWGEDKLEELCKQYGKIEKVRIPRKSAKKHRGFGFVEFSSRESAIACLKGINDDKLGDGDIKVKANIAKPQNKGRLAKIGIRGGFEVNNNEENLEDIPSKTDPKPKAETGIEKGNAHAKSKNIEESKQPKGKHANGQGDVPSQPHKVKEQESKGQGVSFQGPQRKKQALKGLGHPYEGPQMKQKASRGQDGGPSRDHLEMKQQQQQQQQQQRGEKRGNRGMNIRRPSKRARHNYNMRGTPAPDFGQEKPRFGNPKTYHSIHQGVERDLYAPSYVAPAVNYQGRAYHAATGSRYSYSDMKPHAGYLENALDRVVDPYSYEGRSAVAHDSRGRIGAEYIVGSVPSFYHAYQYSSYPGYEARYGGYPSTAPYPPRRLYY